MVHCSACPTYSKTINAEKYHDTEQGSGDRDETRSITSRRNRYWDELDLGAANQSNAVAARHQEGQGGS